MARYRASIFFKPGFPLEKKLKCIEIITSKFEGDRVYSGEFVLTEELLGVLYANLKRKDDQALWKATRSAFLNEKVYVLTLLVEENGGIEELVELIGKDVDPEKCEEGSLRHMFGDGKKLIPNSLYYWFFNWIHRPRTEEEARTQFKAFFPDGTDA
ncbi:hypothetical protein ACFL6I_05545 [candidate division KSB1 bacterium]